MLEVSKATKRAIYLEAYRDLKPRVVVVNGKLLAALLVGGTASLATLAQFGFGLTSWSQAVAAWLGPNTSVATAGLCAAVFPVFPIVVLRSLCNGMQFRAIAQRRPLSLLFWLSAFALHMNARSGFVYDVWTILAWLAAAATSFYGLASVLDKLAFNVRRIANPAS
jgi:hypothetical protein